MADQTTERRAQSRPPEDRTTARLEAMERRITEARRVEIRDMEDRLSRRIQTTEERVIQVETTAVNGHSLLLQKVADVQTTVNGLGQSQTDFMAWMQEQQTRDQQEAAAQHDQAVREQARSDLLLQQQATKARITGRRNRAILAGIGVAGTVVAGITTWLFTQASHQTETTVAFAISGLVFFVLLIFALAWQIDPSTGL